MPSALPGVPCVLDPLLMLAGLGAPGEELDKVEEETARR